MLLLFTFIIFIKTKDLFICTLHKSENYPKKTECDEKTIIPAGLLPVAFSCRLH
jgi:hypothetical protein